MAIHSERRLRRTYTDANGGYRTEREFGRHGGGGGCFRKRRTKSRPYGGPVAELLWWFSCERSFRLFETFTVSPFVRREPAAGPGLTRIRSRRFAERFPRTANPVNSAAGRPRPRASGLQTRGRDIVRVFSNIYAYRVCVSPVAAPSSVPARVLFPRWPDQKTSVRPCTRSVRRFHRLGNLCGQIVTRFVFVCQVSEEYSWGIRGYSGSEA